MLKIVLEIRQRHAKPDNKTAEALGAISRIVHGPDDVIFFLETGKRKAVPDLGQQDDTPALWLKLEAGADGETGKTG